MLYTYGGEFCLSLHFKNLIGYEALRRNYREGGRISQRGNSYLAFYSQFIGDFSFKFTKMEKSVFCSLDLVSKKRTVTI